MGDRVHRWGDRRLAPLRRGRAFFGVVFFFPFGLGGDRARAAIAGALTGASLTALAIHGLAPDLVTLTAGATLVVGLFATVQAFRRP